MNINDPKWIERFMVIASSVSSWSKDTTKVGCVLVAPDGIIIATGYNGIARGVSDFTERLQRPEKYLWVCHSEEAAIANAARKGVRTEGSVLYCTHHPCSRCSRQIINAGIRAVVFGPGTTSMPKEEFEAAEIMLAEAGIHLRQHVPGIL